MTDSDKAIKRILVKADLLGACRDFKDAQLRLFKEEERLEDSGVKEKALAAEPSMAAARKELDAATARAVEVAEQLMVLKKDAAPAAGWGSAECRLGGTWNKIFTTGRDASFRHKRRGNASVSQVVDPVRQTVTNVVTFDGTKNKVQQFKVLVEGRAVEAAPSQIDLQYKEVEVRRRSKIPFLFGRLKLALSRDLILRLVKWGTLGRPDEAQRSFIDVTYLDDDLCIHRAGDGSLFVLQRK